MNCSNAAPEHHHLAVQGDPGSLCWVLFRKKLLQEDGWRKQASKLRRGAAEAGPCSLCPPP